MSWHGPSCYCIQKNCCLWAWYCIKDSYWHAKITTYSSFQLWGAPVKWSLHHGIFLFLFVNLQRTYWQTMCHRVLYLLSSHVLSLICYYPVYIVVRWTHGLIIYCYLIRWMGWLFLLWHCSLCGEEEDPFFKCTSWWQEFTWCSFRLVRQCDCVWSCGEGNDWTLCFSFMHSYNLSWMPKHAIHVHSRKWKKSVTKKQQNLLYTVFGFLFLRESFSYKRWVHCSLLLITSIIFSLYVVFFYLLLSFYIALPFLFLFFFVCYQSSLPFTKICSHT